MVRYMRGSAHIPGPLVYHAFGARVKCKLPPDREVIFVPKNEKATKPGRGRLFATVVYPESAPADWRERLDGLHIAAMVSPIHDADTLPTGERKKAHYHVLWRYDGVKTPAQAQEVVTAIGGAGAVEIVADYRGYARYLCHLDSPDKAQYSPDDIRCYGGADWAAVALSDAERVDAALDEIEDWIDDTGCVSYVELCRYCRRERPDWTRTVRTHTVHLSALIRSAYWEQSQGGDSGVGGCC